MYYKRTRSLNLLFRTFYVLLIIKYCDSNISYDPNNPPCAGVKHAYTQKGFNSRDVPQQAIVGEHLRICQKGPTCCTSHMEHQLSTQSRAEFDQLVKATLGRLHGLLASHSAKLDEFFRALLQTSRKDFHEMFLRTYGLLYDENSHIFQDMFDNLERYYLEGHGDLNLIMDNFFHRLYKKMFEKINVQYTFSNHYLDCVGKLMSKMKPFGDGPQKMTAEIRRSFIAVRTFVQGMLAGRDAVKQIMEVGPSPECSRALMKMSYCPHCQGIPELPPCSSYCLNVLRGCMAYHADLEPYWNQYIEGMLALALRLENAFNLETVMEPLDIKISEAIMNFQENGAEISKRIYDECGQPRLQKRSVLRMDDDIDDGEVVSGSLQFGYLPPNARPTTAAGTRMDRLVQVIKRQLRNTKSFWNDLGDQLCNHFNPMPPLPRSHSKRGQQVTYNLSQTECWDGIAKIRRYKANVTTPGLINQVSNPEVRVDTQSQNYIINQQILGLKMATARLTNAYNGLDVHWPRQEDDEDDDEEGSGGSGSGSGDSNVDLDHLEGETGGGGDLYFTYSTPKSHLFVPPEPHPSSALALTSSFMAVFLLTTALASL